MLPFLKFNSATEVPPIEAPSIFMYMYRLKLFLPITMQSTKGFYPSSRLSHNHIPKVSHALFLHLLFDPPLLAYRYILL